MTSFVKALASSPSCVALKITLGKTFPSALGVGAFLKNNLCLIQGSEAWITDDVGSLETVEACERFEKKAEELLEVAQDFPAIIAHDWHPDFYSTRWVASLQESRRARDNGCQGPRILGIQHHHAHIAAVMAEHGLDEPVLGLALDGFGLGYEGKAWGGELLKVDADGFSRLGHLKELHQPGGDSAARQPWRMGAAALWALGRGNEIAERYAEFSGSPHLAQMMQAGFNAPQTSSAGRLFDAACGLLGILPVAEFEGEAPMKLESMVTDISIDPSGWRIEPVEGGGQTLREGDSVRSKKLVLDMLPLLSTLTDMRAEEGANMFHGTLSAALLDWVCTAVGQTGLSKVALGGGCFFNKVLRETLIQGLKARGITPLIAKKASVGDPAIALGQAYAAAMSISR